MFRDASLTCVSTTSQVLWILSGCGVNVDVYYTPRFMCPFLVMFVVVITSLLFV